MSSAIFGPALRQLYDQVHLRSVELGMYLPTFHATSPTDASTVSQGAAKVAEYGAVGEFALGAALFGGLAYAGIRAYRRLRRARL